MLGPWARSPAAPTTLPRLPAPRAATSGPPRRTRHQAPAQARPRRDAPTNARPPARPHAPKPPQGAAPCGARWPPSPLPPAPPPWRGARAAFNADSRPNGPREGPVRALVYSAGGGGGGERRPGGASRGAGLRGVKREPQRRPAGKAARRQGSRGAGGRAGTTTGLPIVKRTKPVVGRTNRKIGCRLKATPGRGSGGPTAQGPMRARASPGAPGPGPPAAPAGGGPGAGPPPAERVRVPGRAGHFGLAACRGRSPPSCPPPLQVVCVSGAPVTLALRPAGAASAGSAGRPPAPSGR
jgi:hypothetical protein